MLWASCALAAVLLMLGTSGTLSSFTVAALNNTKNTSITASAVILREVGPDGTASHTSQTCDSSAVATNVSTCATIDKYGGVATPLSPGASQTTDVTFTNIGGSAASTFVFTPGTCTQTPTAGSGSPAASDLCSGGDFTVAISCSNGATYVSGSAWTGTDIVQTAVKPASLVALTHTGSLAAGAQWTCRFTVALAAAAAVADQGVQVSQPITWTLNK